MVGGSGLGREPTSVPHLRRTPENIRKLTSQPALQYPLPQRARARTVTRPPRVSALPHIAPRRRCEDPVEMKTGEERRGESWSQPRRRRNDITCMSSLVGWKQQKLFKHQELLHLSVAAVKLATVVDIYAPSNSFDAILESFKRRGAH